MIGVTTILNIKQRCNKGDSVAQIAREEGISEPTVRKYRDLEDVSAPLPVKKTRKSMLDSFKPIIDSWLQEDKRRKPKQRHSAKRIFDRLVEEHEYKGSYSTICAYVKSKKDEARNTTDEFLKLDWAPSEAQVDFGQCDFKVLGIVLSIHFLVVTFPFSNVSFAQCFQGENAECVCQGLKSIFEYIGGVPQRLIFDNATGVGRRIGQVVQTTETFSRFVAHYGFDFSFCNPYSGHEKGAVENAVGTIRRNLFVPMPRINNIVAYNKKLLDKCYARANKTHYQKNELEAALFEEDKAALLELPAKAFRVYKHDSFKSDKYGDVRIEGKHTYPLGPQYATKHVIAELGAFEVAFYTEQGEKIISYPRAYGDVPTMASDPLSQLALLVRKPGGWQNSQVRSSLPEQLRKYIDSLDKTQRKTALDSMCNAAGCAGYQATIKAMEDLSVSNTELSEANVVTKALLIAHGQQSIAYDEKVDLASYDVVFRQQVS